MSSSGEKSGSESKPENDAQVSQKLLADLAKMLGQQAPQQKMEPKDLESYKFWKTQPVMAPGSKVDSRGAIEKKTIDDVAKEPQALPKGFQWCVIDVTSKDQLKELYDLLYDNYVEDDDEQFRFRYSIEFLEWALKAPGWYDDLTIGVRTEQGKLVASISGVPVTLRVKDEKLKLSEINFLCVHKKLRSKRLAPVLIKEITRRCNLHGIWQALYTSGSILPTPVSTCRYYHRTINWPKLYDVGFTYLPPGSTPEAQIKKHAVKAQPTLEGFRPLKKEDMDQVFVLLDKYLSRFEMAQVFEREELEHWLLSAPNVLKAFVVEQDGKITDFVSFYGLESTVLGEAKHSSINVAYSYYYATTASGSQLKPRLVALFEDALVETKKADFDVLNALTLLDNPLFLEELLFGKGDGLLHYYLFNYKTPRIGGGIDKSAEISQPGGVGIIML